MRTLLSIIIPAGVIYTLVVVVVSFRIFRRMKKFNWGIAPVNVFPASLPVLSENDKFIIGLYQVEWKTIIETQMHFNDLIIRFRSILLTAFVTLFGASLALNKYDIIGPGLFGFVALIVLVLWLTAFVMDNFYYHQLLLGSVAQAMKFDDSDWGRRLGLFGMTTCIGKAVGPLASKIIVYFFYLVPAFTLIALIGL